MAYKTDKEKKDAKRRSNRECYYRRQLALGEIPKAIKLRSAQTEREKDLRELMLNLRAEVAELKSLILKIT